MKKTPIIAGLVGLGILGGAYFGGLYVSSNTAMSKLHEWVSFANQYSGKHYDIIEENKGLFSSTAHVTVTDLLESTPAADAHVVLHHGIFSTDIDGKLMVDHPLWTQMKVIKNNGGMDISGHLNNFKAKGSFLQVGINVPSDKADAKGQDTSVMLRAEPFVDFDQLTQDKLHGLIAQGIDGQEKAKADGKETNIMVSLTAHGPYAKVDIQVPVLYQQNSNASDISSTMYFNIDGKDVLKPHGIQSVDLLSHYTKDARKLGSYMSLNIPGTLSVPDEHGTSALSDFSLFADVSEKGAKALIRVASTDIEDHGHFTSGPISMAIMLDADTYNEALALSDSLKGKPSEEQLAALKKLAIRLPDVHVEMHDIVKVSKDDDEVNSSLKSATLDVVRDPSAAVTRVTVAAADFNSDEVKHGNFSQTVSVDQSIVDTALSVLQTVGNAHAKPTDEQVNSMMQQALTLVQSSPKIVLNELRFSAESLPQALVATGEASIAGNTIHSIDDIDYASFIAHLTITGLPDEMKKSVLDESQDTDDKPININLMNGHVTVNGKEAL